MRTLLGTVMLVALIAATPVRAQEDIPAPLAPLSDAEREQATAAASRAIVDRSLRAEGPLVLVAVEPIRSKDRLDQRLAVATYYRYRGDLTISTTVDLGDGSVVNVTSETGIPAPLAKEELDRARELALADRRVQAAIPDRTGLVVEGLLLRAASRRDPYYGKRAVRLLFKQGDQYLSEPVVEVDLTSGKVIVDERPGPAEPLHH
jgi:hypothetical protein